MKAEFFCIWTKIFWNNENNGCKGFQ